jgi:uncharacterized membrane protein YdjX (TVP38/TMEM64 family)
MPHHQPEINRSEANVRPLVKGLFLLCALCTAIAVIHLTPIRNFLEDAHFVSLQIKNLGWWSPLAFSAAVAILVSLGVPRLLLCSIGGMAFGFAWGLIWSQIGTVVGYYMTFLFVRWSGREFILNKWPRLNKYNEFFRAKGILIVLLIRQMPVAGFYINMVLGLTHIRHANFLLGTFAGILPEAIPATLIGAGVIALTPGKGIAAISAAVFFFIIVWSVVGWYFHSSKFKLSADVNGSDQIGKEEISV